jgi:hypothetical protein
MFLAIGRRFTYANVVATLALVFAMSGGAYAASRYLITSPKQISPKVLKSLKGTAGKPGSAGAIGAAGPAGLAGAAGAQGLAGAKGETGPAGPQGPEGKKGAAGSPWTAGGTLPVGATETGVWAFGPITEAAKSGAFGATFVPLASFTVRLAAALDAGHVHFINSSGQEVTGFNGEEELTAEPTQCPGTVAEPAAASGNLCVYAAAEFNVAVSSLSLDDLSTSSTGAGETGAMALMKLTGAEAFGRGTWAVTG